MLVLPSEHALSETKEAPESVPGINDLLNRLEAVSAGTGDERRDTRERILAAAIELFAVEGFQAASMRRLATAVGISAPGLYSHFPSKEVILSASMTRAMHAFISEVVAPIDEGPDINRLEGLMRRHLRFQIKNRTLVQASDSLLNNESVLKFAPAPIRQLLREAQRVYFTNFREVIRNCADPNRKVDPNVDTFAVITLCDNVTSWYRSSGRLTATEIENQHWELVQGMLGLKTSK